VPDPLSVVFIDNFDSFTWNLVDELGRRGAAVRVWRNTLLAEEAIARARERSPSLIILSPGPGAPAAAGCCVALARLAARERVPLFGVCLGHQAIVEASGGRVGPAGEVVHGKAAPVRHEGHALFEGVPSPFAAGRYHSLAARELPSCLTPIAGSGGIVMAIAHTTAPQLGVQFHPESILTPDGGRILSNVIRWATDARR